MTQKRYTVEEFANKVDWEGGLYEAVTSYGLKSSDLDDNAPRTLVALLKQFEDAAIRVSTLEDEIMDFFEDE